MDLLSKLPDDVVGHILSFLTTKEAALTCVLSKRWRNLLAFVPNLVIDDRDFLHRERGKGLREDIRQSFMDFVDRVLALQGSSPIKKFSLDVSVGVDIARVNRWIQNVMVRSVSEINLSVTRYTESGDDYNLFTKVFENKKLIKLELRGAFDFCSVDGRIFLPMLKTLVLESVSISVDKFEILLHALPSLEELVLGYIDWKEEEDAYVSISSASLKTLRIECSWELATFSFDTPSLFYFYYADYVVDNYSVAKMVNLFEARISLLKEQIIRARAPNNDGLDDDVLRLANVGKLMNGIRYVRYLVLSPDTLEDLSLCTELMPVFNNLKKLAVKSGKKRAWQAMPVPIRKSPHLETLVLEGLLHYVTDKCGDDCDCIPQEDKGR